MTELVRLANEEMDNVARDYRDELANLETVTRYVDDLRRLLDESSLIERKSFVRSFVKEVKDLFF